MASSITVEVKKTPPLKCSRGVFCHYNMGLARFNGAYFLNLKPTQALSFISFGLNVEQQVLTFPRADDAHELFVFGFFDRQVHLNKLRPEHFM